MGIIYFILLWMMHPIGVYTAYLLEEALGGVVYTEYYSLVSPNSVPKDTKGLVVAGLLFRGILAKLVLVAWLFIYGCVVYRINKYMLIVLALCYVVSTLINFNYMDINFGGRNRLKYKGDKRYNELIQLRNSLYIIKNSMDKAHYNKLERLIERLLENYWKCLSGDSVMVEFNGDGVLSVITFGFTEDSKEYPSTAKKAYIFARDNLKMLEKCIYYLKSELASIKV